MSAEEVRDEALTCRNCGADPRGGTAASAGTGSGFLSSDSYAGRVLFGETRWRTAPFVRRLLAATIDAVLIAIVAIPGALMVMQGWFSEPAHSLGLSAGGSGLLLIALAYALTKDGWPGGAGIGKRILGLRVIVADTGVPCTVARAIARGAVTVVLSSMPYAGWAIEPAVALVAAGGRRLADHVAQTQVVSNREPPRR